MGTLILRAVDELRISSTLSIKTSCSSGGRRTLARAPASSSLPTRLTSPPYLGAPCSDSSHREPVLDAFRERSETYPLPRGSLKFTYGMSTSRASRSQAMPTAARSISNGRGEWKASSHNLNVHFHILTPDGPPSTIPNRSW
jgi:hypothetical protein